LLQTFVIKGNAMNKLLIALFIVTTLPACSSRSFSENGCRFIKGVYDSKAEDEQRLALYYQSEEKNNAHHIINGLFEILNGSLVKEDKCSQDKIEEPTFEFSMPH
jgi:hypothetical protein